MSNQSNGASNVKVAPKTVPATLTVEVGPFKITTHAKPSPKQNVWFEGRQKATLAPGADIEAVLLSVPVIFEGEVIEPSKNSVIGGNKVLRETAARKYGRNNAKAGQDIPNTGGQPMISFVKMLPNWGETGYMLRVTLKGDERNAEKIVVVISATPRPDNSRSIGDVEGDLVLG